MAKRKRSHSANRAGSRSGGVAPSTYETAANNLTEKREIAFRRRVPREQPRDASEVAGDINRLFQATRPQRRAQNYVAGIEEVMKAEHDDEVSYNTKLYEALRSFLEARKLAVPCLGSATKRASEPIVLKFTAPGKEEYALGIAREVNCEQKRDDYAPCTRSEITVSGVKAQTKLDHCCCLLKKDSAGNYQVAECLAIAELKLSSTKECNAFENFDTIHNTINLAKGHGTLAQVMSYTMGWVLPSHAKLHQLGDDIPWAVLVGKKTKVDEETEPEPKRQKSTGPNVNRWVSGKIYIPDKCGDAFEYAVTGYGTLEEVENDGTVRDAVSVYLDTILAGLAVGKRWMESPEPVVPCAASGKKVCIGQKELDCQLRGSATIANFPYSSRKERNRWDVAQGEIFTGNLNVGAIYTQLSVDDKQLVRAFNKNNQEVRAVVKVSSVAVHHYLNHPEKAWSALVALYQNRQLRASLSEVLFAVCVRPKGLITIMANLSPTYKALRPIKNKAPLTVLWKAFRRLVMKIIFPMACLGFIHPDIRPGYNITSNVLCEVQDGGGRARMKLIDYESIVRHQAWAPPDADFRYIAPKANARMFLWWQCLSVFYAWKEKRSQKTMKSICLEDTLLCDETDSDESAQSGESGLDGEDDDDDDDNDESSSDGDDDNEEEEEEKGEEEEEKEEEEEADDSYEENDDGNDAETGSNGNLENEVESNENGEGNVEGNEENSGNLQGEEGEEEIEVEGNENGEGNVEGNEENGGNLQEEEENEVEGNENGEGNEENGGNLQGDEDNEVEGNDNGEGNVERNNDDGETHADDEGGEESNDSDDVQEESEDDGETIERPDWFDKKFQKISKRSDLSESDFKRALRKLGVLLVDDDVEY